MWTATWHVTETKCLQCTARGLAKESFTSSMSVVVVRHSSAKLALQGGDKTCHTYQHVQAEQCLVGSGCQPAAPAAKPVGSKTRGSCDPNPRPAAHRQALRNIALANDGTTPLLLESHAPPAQAPLAALYRNVRASQTAPAPSAKSAVQVRRQLAPKKSCQ